MAPHTHAQGRANPLNSVEEPSSGYESAPSKTINLNQTNSHKNLMDDRLQIEDHQP